MTLLTEREAASLLRLSERTLERRYRVSGTGPKFVRLGRSIRYWLTEIEAFIALRTVGSTSELPAQAVLFDIVKSTPGRGHSRQQETVMPTPSAPSAPTKPLEAHPLADIFPMLDQKEPTFIALVEDIKANGLHEPVTLLDGKILDGRNRYEARGH
jgi:predicted DNA-binding transcriptional regulator AlpA